MEISEKRKMDYEKEMNKLKSGSGDTFKPDAGVYKVTILGEPEECEFKDSKTGEVTPQIKLLVEHSLAKGQFNWFVGKGLTMMSTFGQLVAVGKARGGLSGQVITLVVKEGKDRKEYTIVEAAEIIKAAKVVEEKVE